MEEEKFNQKLYMRRWQREHMTTVSARYTNEFVEQFKAACSKLGIAQADVIRKAMEDTISKSERKK